MDRWVLLTAATSAGCVYGAVRVLLAVLYPTVVSYVWQSLVGPGIAGRWPQLAQHEDVSRYSYLALDNSQPYVWRFGLDPVPIDDLSQGLRDGVLIGLVVALLPEMVALTFAFMLVVVLFKNALRIRKCVGPGRTDQFFFAVRELLMFCGLVAAANAANAASLLYPA
jgi:hypothetical protein